MRIQTFQFFLTSFLLSELEAPDSSDSEDDADELAKKVSGPNATARLTARVKSLQKQLSQAKQDLQMMRTMVKGRLELLASDPAQPTDEKPAARDDDTHYFESYAYNGGAVCLHHRIGVS